MSSDVFLLSAVHEPDALGAIRSALEAAGIDPARIQDIVFGIEPGSAFPGLDGICQAAGLRCGWITVGSGLRALSFCTAAILSDDMDLAVVAELGRPEATALVLASPEAVGLHNLLPRARIAARSLAGTAAALRLGGIELSDVQVEKDGTGLRIVEQMLAELETQDARWGLVSGPSPAVLIERI